MLFRSRRPALPRERPLGFWGFGAVAVAAFGGPLALSALMAPSLLTDAAPSAGLSTLAGAVLFVAPLTIWLRYARHVHGPGGLSAFVEAAAGRRVALGQAAIWTVSYVLYVIYTTVQIVYDVLPGVLPGERRYQTVLAVALPVVLAAVVIAGRAATVLMLAVIAAGQVAVGGLLAGVAIGHLGMPASSFAPHVPARTLATAGAQTSLLYICGGLPVFLGGEIAAPAQTIRRGLTGAYLIAAVLVVGTAAPLAAAPGLAGTALPGVSVAQQFAGARLAQAVGVGVAVSTAGVMLCEYLALTRLIHAVTTWGVRRAAVMLGAVFILVAPISLVNPDRFYGALVKPSLVALWVSQLIVFAVYPLFARRHRQPMRSAWALTLVASGLVLYGLWSTLQQSVS